MRDILIIKTSSLGDVVHQMPAVTDIRRAMPEARLSWVVEEAFAPLVRLHPAVARVIPVASRRWRKALGDADTWSQARRFLAELREHPFDAVVDTQGLVRSALIARAARGVRHGYAFDSVREKAAALFYDVRHHVGRTLHAVARNRLLTAQALAIAAEGPPDYGLDPEPLRAPQAPPYAVLLHATAREEKLWPGPRWIALGEALAARGLDLVLPWGSAEERRRSEVLASSLPRARVPERRPLDDVARLIAGATLVAGVDTGLLHLAAALERPLVGIFVATEPGLTGPLGNGPMTVVGGRDGAPSAGDVIAAAERLLQASGLSHRPR